MRKVLLLILFFITVGQGIAFTQVPESQRVEENPIIESVEISGVTDDKVTSDLKDAMQKLVGQRFDQLAADEVGFGIQEAISQRISAIRQIPGSAADRVKLLFEFSNNPPDENSRGRHGIHIDWDTNVNSRYTIEVVELRGIPDSLISDRLREDMHKLMGEKLDEGRVGDIEHRLRRELRPGHTVSRRVERGSDRDHIRLLFEVEKTPLLDFHKFGNYLVGQSKQGVSYGAAVDIDHRNNRIAVGVRDDGDLLIERDEGYRLGFENIKSGTEHLGFRIEYFDYRQKWKSETELALQSSPNVPGLYRKRRGIEPLIMIAANRHLQIDAGVSVTSLQIQQPVAHFQNANAFVGSVAYKGAWRDPLSNEHQLTADYTIRTASHNLDSDFIYTRHFGEVRYDVRAHRSEFIGIGMGGILTGNAPLFERFSLGNTSTLRGWNKYELAPIGGSRMAYGSLEYRYWVMQVFYDVGAVWQQPNGSDLSHSVGLGVHSQDKNNTWFMSFGVPIRSGHIQPLKPIFMAGVRF